MAIKRIQSEPRHLAFLDAVAKAITTAHAQHPEISNLEAFAITAKLLGRQATRVALHKLASPTEVAALLHENISDGMIEGHPDEGVQALLRADAAEKAVH